MKNILLISLVTFELMSCGNGKPVADHPVTNTETKMDTLAAPGVVNYLSVPGPFRVGEYDFHLGWSSNPSENYFKQEYFPRGNLPENYTQMVMVELLIGDFHPKDIMTNKAKETEARKPADYLAKAIMLSDPTTGEEVLEFMWSENEGEDNGIVEWNVYRYIPYTDADGKKGIKLFGFSRRGYGQKTQPFIGDIQRNSEKFKADFLAVQAPMVTPPK